MVNKIASDESLQILVFVCLPLVLLLIGFIVLLIRHSRDTAVFATFSVSISRVGRAAAYVRYGDPARQLEFEAEIRRGRSFFIPEILVQIPNSMPEQDLSAVVPSLVHGLEKLHYQYLIFRKGKPQVIPEEERNAAISELREMGVDIQTSSDQEGIQRAVVGDWRNTVGKRASVVMPKLMALMNKARGVRESIEILAQSQIRK